MLFYITFVFITNLIPNVIEENFSENLQTSITQVNSNDIRGSLIRDEFIAGNFS